MGGTFAFPAITEAKTEPSGEREGYQANTSLKRTQVVDHLVSLWNGENGDSKRRPQEKCISVDSLGSHRFSPRGNSNNMNSQYHAILLVRNLKGNTGSLVPSALVTIHS